MGLEVLFCQEIDLKNEIMAFQHNCIKRLCSPFSDDDIDENKKDNLKFLLFLFYWMLYFTCDNVVLKNTALLPFLCSSQSFVHHLENIFPLHVFVNWFFGYVPLHTIRD